MTVVRPGKQAADRLVGLSPHHDVVAQRETLEELLFIRQFPRNDAVGADHAVTRHRDNQREPDRVRIDALSPVLRPRWAP